MWLELCSSDDSFLFCFSLSTQLLFKAACYSSKDIPRQNRIITCLFLSSLIAQFALFIVVKFDGQPQDSLHNGILQLAQRIIACPWLSLRIATLLNGPSYTVTNLSNDVFTCVFHINAIWLPIRFCVSPPPKQCKLCMFCEPKGKFMLNFKGRNTSCVGWY